MSEFERAGEHQIDDEVTALIHHIRDFAVVEISG